MIGIIVVMVGETSMRCRGLAPLYSLFHTGLHCRAIQGVGVKTRSLSCETGGFTAPPAARPFLTGRFQRHFNLVFAQS